jgi:N-dimethylarginine dimethylaminohydrolase
MPSGNRNVVEKDVGILMPAGGHSMRQRYEDAGVVCHTVEIDECIKAGGGIHCMTGFLKRDRVLTS